MNVEEVRDFALSLPGVTEDQVFGDDVVNFRIEGKIFLCLWLGHYGPGMPRMEEPRFALKLTPERNTTLRMEYGGVQPAYHWNKKHWSDVYYESGIADELLKDWMRESYLLVLGHLPKALRQKYQ